LGKTLLWVYKAVLGVVSYFVQLPSVAWRLMILRGFTCGRKPLSGAKWIINVILCTQNYVTYYDFHYLQRISVLRATEIRSKKCTWKCYCHTDTKHCCLTHFEQWS